MPSRKNPLSAKGIPKITGQKTSLSSKVENTVPGISSKEKFSVQRFKAMHGASQKGMLSIGPSDREMLLEGVLDAALDAIITTDDRQRIILFNKGAEKMFGCSLAEVNGKSIARLIPMRFRKIHRDHVRQFIQSGDTARSGKQLGKLIGLRSDGYEFPMEASISQVEINGEKLLTIILRDISERRKSEEALEKERQFVTKVLDAAGALVVVLDRDWRILRFNRACEALTGKTFMEVKGKSFLDFMVVSGEDTPEVQNLLTSFKSKKFPEFFENVWLDHKRQVHWIRWSTRELTGKGGAMENIIATGIDITLRKQTEQELKKEQEFISAVLDTAGALIVVLDRQGRIVRFNRACEKLTGFSFKNIRGKCPWEFLLLPEEIPEVKKIFDALRNGVKSIRFENHWVTQNHTIRRIAWSNTILENHKGHAEHIVGIGIDVTDRRKAEEEVHRLLKHNELILHSAGEGIYGLDEHGYTTFVNPSAAEMLGYDPQEILGLPMHQTVHHSWPDGSPYSLEVCPIYKALKDGMVHRSEEILWRKDGTNFPVEYMSTPILGENKEIEGAVVTFKDITERKLGDEALRESEERFQAFMNYSPAVKFLKDRHGRYVFVNQQFEEELRMPKATCLGKTDQELFPPEVTRMFKEHDAEVLEKGEVLETEETTLGESGQIRFWWVVKFPVYRLDGEVQLGGVAFDITLRKEVEETLRRREVELQESQELLRALGGALITAQEDERRRISRELHDDMNQRLAVLAFNLQTAQRALPESDPMQDVLQALYEGVSSLSDDVRHLAYQLHPSILDDLGLEVALRSLVEDFAKWEGIPMAFTAKDVPSSLSPKIASCMYRVTQESLRNVAKHAKASQVEVKLVKDGDGLRLSLADNGKGFDRQEIQSGKHGLGLVGMQERIRLVQGTYEMTSAPGEGTTITAWVPVEEVKSK